MCIFEEYFDILLHLILSKPIIRFGYLQNRKKRVIECHEYLVEFIDSKMLRVHLNVSLNQRKIFSQRLHFIAPFPLHNEKIDIVVIFWVHVYGYRDMCRIYQIILYAFLYYNP